jgi:hypothetical protein
MQLTLRGTFIRLATLVVAMPMRAQAPSLGGEQEQQVGHFSLSPYIGAVVPTADLLKLAQSGGTPAQNLKLSTALVVGGRLGIMFNSRVGIQLDVGYSPGSADFSSSTGTVVANTDITTFTGVGKVVVYVIPSTSWVWMSVSGGAGMIQHKFKEGGPAALSGLKDGTNTGGVVGATLGVRIWKLVALTGSVEDYLYNATFDKNGTKTSETKQNDFRFTGGIRIPFLGM